MSWFGIRAAVRQHVLSLVALTLAGPAAAQEFLDKPSGAVRIVTWNIAANSIFPEGPDSLTSEIGRPAAVGLVTSVLHLGGMTLPVLLDYRVPLRAELYGMPLGLGYLGLAVWLMGKGFKEGQA